MAAAKKRSASRALNEIETEFENVRSAWGTMIEKCCRRRIERDGLQPVAVANLRCRYPEALTCTRGTGWTETPVWRRGS